MPENPPRPKPRPIVEIMSLHWYYLNASEMKELFVESASADLAEPLKRGEVKYTDFMTAHRYMSLWYGCLFVVAEGWNDLGLKDALVEKLMAKSNYMDLLRGYRNDTFHFQGHYFRSRSGKFVGEKGSADWVRKLHSALGTAILKEIRARKKPQP